MQNSKTERRSYEEVWGEFVSSVDFFLKFEESTRKLFDSEITKLSFSKILDNFVTKLMNFLQKVSVSMEKNHKRC